MKSTLLRVLCAAIVIVFTVTAVFADTYAQRRVAEDAKILGSKQNEEKLITADADQKNSVLNESLKENQKKGHDRAETMRERSTYSLQPVDSEFSLFINKVDSYSIRIPENLQIDMSFSGIRAVLKNQNLTIEIYRQKTGTTSNDGVLSYINYSNQFIENNIDHQKELEGKTRIDGRNVFYLEWSRRHLKNIKNDKHYYASVDVPISENEVLTFMLKSTEPFESKSYLDLIESLQFIDFTEKPYMRKIEMSENPAWDDSTKKAFEQYFGEESKLNWGIFETDAPVNFEALKKIEEKVDFTFPILLYYTGILEYKETHPSLSIALQNAKKEGRMLELTLQTVAQSPGEGNMVYDILDGKYDTYLKNYANQVALYGEPILFRLGNEMNGDWCVYSSHHTSKDTDIFKAFYRYVYEIFRNAGADNVIWVWNPNGKSFPDFKWNDELCYYPGDNYVDVIGMTGYNTGTYYDGETWMEFDQMYDSLYEKYTERYEKPLMITEFSSSSVGGNKETWVSNMFRHIDRYNRIKVAVWWDGCDWDSEGNVARSYFIDESEGLIQIFKENLAQYKQ